MKLYTSRDKDEAVTALAIVETLAASAVALWLAARWETLAPFAVSAVVAPFLLMRTRDSTAYGIRLARRFVRWDKTLGTYEHTTLSTLGTIFLPIIIRVWATTVFIIREPLTCLSAVPTNWWQLIAYSDLTRPPAAITGYRWKYRPRRRFEGSLWDIKGLLEISATIPWRLKMIAFFLLIPIVFGPAWVYRWTLKSTWWVYLPFLWVIQPARVRLDNAWNRLQWIRDDRLVVWYSAFVIVAGIIKIRIWQLKVTFAEWWNENLVGQLLNIYIAPNSMPVWQYAAIANSILAIVMFIVAGNAIRLLATTEAWPEKYVDYGFRWATIVRRLLTFYTVVVLVTITLRRGFPPLGNFFPL